MSLLARIILELISILEQFKAKRKEAKRDAAAKAVQDNPASWFSGHFGGVPDDLPDQADDASKADTKPD